MWAVFFEQVCGRQAGLGEERQPWHHPDASRVEEPGEALAAAIRPEQDSGSGDELPAKRLVKSWAIQGTQGFLPIAGAEIKPALGWRCSARARTHFAILLLGHYLALRLLNTGFCL